MFTSFIPCVLYSLCTYHNGNLDIDYVLSFRRFYLTDSCYIKEGQLGNSFVRVVIGDGVYVPVKSCKVCEEDRIVFNHILTLT